MGLCLVCFYFLKRLTDTHIDTHTERGIQRETDRDKDKQIKIRQIERRENINFCGRQKGGTVLEDLGNRKSMENTL